LIAVAPELRIETPEGGEGRRRGEYCRGDQQLVVDEIEITDRARGKRSRRQHYDYGDRERIAAAAPRFETERTSRAQIEGESAERK
jgi:hypothetical protein